MYVCYGHNSSYYCTVLCYVVRKIPWICPFCPPQHFATQDLSLLEKWSLLIPFLYITSVLDLGCGESVILLNMEGINFPTYSTYAGLLMITTVYRSQNKAASTLWKAQMGRPLFWAILSLKKCSITDAGQIDCCETRHACHWQSDSNQELQWLMLSLYSINIFISLCFFVSKWTLYWVIIGGFPQNKNIFSAFWEFATSSLLMLCCT